MTRTNQTVRQTANAASMSREEWTEARFGDGRCACDQCWEADGYRIEADRCMSDYDALEVDVGIMLEALTKIAALRPNKAFDPWARAIAEDALSKVSERVTDLAAI